MTATVVSAELCLRLIASQQVTVPLVASFRYSTEDPCAVHIAFHVGLDEPVEWTIARDLLADGLKGREGLGDVQIWLGPDTSDLFGQALHIKLSSPFGEAHFEAPIPEASKFLRRTYRVVPLGEESRFIDFESGLAGLLNQE